STPWRPVSSASSKARAWRTARRRPRRRFRRDRPGANLAREGGALREILESIEREYRRYKGLGEATFDQLDARQLAHVAGAEGNSVVTLVWHISGNLKSRFTDFLTKDGEKPWRQRETEFEPRAVTPAELRQKWEEGWRVLFEALHELEDSDLG